MHTTENLLQRLAAIGERFSQEEGALGLLALGSVGLERERLDAYSDLDFFAIVATGSKNRFMNNLDWLHVVPTSFIFRNTADGYKYLYEDGIYAEMAIFEPDEVRKVGFAPGRWVWRHPGLSESLAIPHLVAEASFVDRSDEWLLGELVTCLYVGAGRFLRGEKISAFRFVQVYCVDFLLCLWERKQRCEAKVVDIFSRERRYEQRHPELQSVLAKCMLGYEETPQAIVEILSFAESHWPVAAVMSGRIRELMVEARSLLSCSAT